MSPRFDDLNPCLDVEMYINDEISSLIYDYNGTNSFDENIYKISTKMDNINKLLLSDEYNYNKTNLLYLLDLLKEHYLQITNENLKRKVLLFLSIISSKKSNILKQEDEVILSDIKERSYNCVLSSNLLANTIYNDVLNVLDSLDKYKQNATKILLLDVISLIYKTNDNILTIIISFLVKKYDYNHQRESMRIKNLILFLQLFNFKPWGIFFYFTKWRIGNKPINNIFW